MGDHQRSTALHNGFEGFLNEGFVLGIEGAGGFVEQQQAGVAHDGAGDGDALALAAGKAHAFFAQVGVEPIGQGFDEGEGGGGLRGGAHFFIRRVGLAGADVGPGIGGEDDGVLRHHADMAAPLARVEGADIVPIDADDAELRVVKTQQQLEEGGFTGTAGADDGHRLARLDAEADIAQRGDVGARGVMEGDMLERQARLRFFSEAVRLRRGGDGGGQLHGFHQPLGGTGGALQLADDIADRAEGAGDDHGVENERREVAGAEAAGNHILPAGVEHGDDAAEH